MTELDVAAAADFTETVARFSAGGQAYTIDDLGICRPSQAGTYAVYDAAGRQLGEFDWPCSAAPTADDLIEQARRLLDPLRSDAGSA